MFFTTRTLLVLAATASLCACSDNNVQAPTAPATNNVTTSPPANLTTVSFDGDQQTIWPFAGTDLSGSASDPINLIFRGHADVRSLRAALMALNGDRTAFGFPNAFPFNCTWSDA